MSAISFKIDLRRKIIEDATMLSIIGERMFPSRAPQDVATPYMVFHSISGFDDLVHSAAVEINECRIQFDIYDRIPETLESARDRLVELLHGFKGTLNALYSTQVTQARYVDERDMSEYEEELYSKQLDFIFRFRQ